MDNIDLPEICLLCDVIVPELDAQCTCDDHGECMCTEEAVCHICEIEAASCYCYGPDACAYCEARSENEPPLEDEMDQIPEERPPTVAAPPAPTSIIGPPASTPSSPDDEPAAENRP